MTPALADLGVRMIALCLMGGGLMSFMAFVGDDEGPDGYA